MVLRSRSLRWLDFFGRIHFEIEKLKLHLVRKTKTKQKWIFPRSPPFDETTPSRKILFKFEKKSSKIISFGAKRSPLALSNAEMAVAALN